MTLSLILLKQISIMFLLMGIGFILFRMKFITKKGSRELGNILLYIVMPSIILKSFLNLNAADHLDGFVSSLWLSILAMAVSIVIAKIVFGKKYKIEHFGTAFSNAGFIGIPLVDAVLGQDAVIYVTSFLVLVNFLQWTYGQLVMTDSYHAIRLRVIGKNPIVISVIIGLVCWFGNVQIPVVVADTVSYCSAMNAPLAMIIMGCYLAQTNIKGLIHNKPMYPATFLRLCVIPVVTILVFLLAVGVDLTIRRAVLIAAATPIGSNVAIFAQQNNLDYTQAVDEVCFSTLCSILTLPLILELSNRFW